jgi:hypothetical protein
MTPVPEPRTDSGSPGLEAAEWRLLQAIREVGDDVREMRADVTRRFERLPEQFVPRPEIGAWRDESTRDRQALRGELIRCETKHDADVRRIEESLGASFRALTDRMDGEEKERANAVRWALGLVATIIIALAGLGLTLFTNLS